MLIDMEGIVRISDEFNKVHYGEVVDNEDPKKIGRVKVTIEFIYEGNTEDLPWVYPHQFSPSSLYVPQVGEKVKISFRNGDIYQPEYIGYYHSTVNHDTELEADYPDTFGIHKRGFKARYNMKTELLEIIAKNGSFIKMNKDGDTTFYSTRDFFSKTDRNTKFETKKFDILADEDITFSTDQKFVVTAQGNIAFTSQGKVDISSVGNLTLSTQGNANISATGTATFSGTGGTNVGNNASITNVNGAIVNLGGGGASVAVVGSQATGIGNKGAPVISTIISGSTKVFAPL